MESAFDFFYNSILNNPSMAILYIVASLVSLVSVIMWFVKHPKEKVRKEKELLKKFKKETSR